MKAVYVHGIDCDEAADCTEAMRMCDGFMQVPSEEDIAAIIASQPDAMPIAGWQFTARVLIEMFDL